MACFDLYGAQMLQSYLVPFDCVSEKHEMFVFDSQMCLTVRHEAM